jgi:hypothetical protein
MMKSVLTAGLLAVSAAALAQLPVSFVEPAND